MNYARALAMCSATVTAAAVIVGITAPVQAQPAPSVTVIARPADQLTRSIDYADLNLATDSGVQVLNSRVSYAVNDVCRLLMTESYQDSMQECTSDSLDRARPQVSMAVQRAREIAATGSSSIAAVAITIGSRQ
jgi:UrcA family protein